MSKARFGSTRADAAGPVTPASIGAFDLGPGTPLVSGEDLDDFTEPGTYSCASGTLAAALANAPQTSYGFKLFVMVPKPGQAIQLAITNIGACTLYLRRYTGSSWGTWRHITTTQ
jgi:hypothetical protein